MVDNAQKVARKTVESTYIGTCDIVEFAETTDAETGITRFTESVTVKNQPCRLSFEDIYSVNQTKTGAGISQKVKLFIAPEIKVNSGSKIIATQNGITKEYGCTGEPAVYFSHQEIMLELFKEWA